MIDTKAQIVKVNLRTHLPFRGVVPCSLFIIFIIVKAAGLLVWLLLLAPLLLVVALGLDEPWVILVLVLVLVLVIEVLMVLVVKLRVVEVVH